MSFQAKRELLGQVGPRYREASYHQKTNILDEFIACTGYARKYAIRLLSQPMVLSAPIRRPRARRYGKTVQEALATAWAAANFICAKRLVPFLPELVKSLEDHGHLALVDEVRDQLLAISPATADRILQTLRQSERPHGLTTTKRGNLLKHQVPVRTFSDWSDAKPGFFEGDLVAHCGTSAGGAFLCSLVLTDVATAWTECLALRVRGQEAVTQTLDLARQLLPFPMLGIDTDNGSEFLNNELIAYCGRERITFTRGRAYRQNDQCFVEQKNGSIVRQLVGYDRYEGEVAYRQLTELYRAVRLYVNFFQPSMKLQAKRREGSKVQRTYDAAQTPFRRVLASKVLPADTGERLERVYAALDPVRLLEQIHTLQDALWKHAVRCPAGTANDHRAEALPPTVRFDADVCLPIGDDLPKGQETGLKPPTVEMAATGRQRKYHHARKSLGPRTYRTRKDPFAEVHEEVYQRFLEAPHLTAKQLFCELQQRYPGQYRDVLLRTLQRRVREWRAKVILMFDDRLLQEDLLIGYQVPGPLRARVASAVAIGVSAQNDRSQ